MGVVVVISPCIGCQLPFSYHPHLVPSVVVKGQREPVCEDCVRNANPLRIANGLEPIAILPGAYEPCEESEL